MSKFTLFSRKKTKKLISPGRPPIQLELDDNTLYRLYAQGASIASLARKCRCSETTIRRHLGIDKLPPP